MQNICFTPRSTSDLRRVIYVCGIANLLAFGLLVPLSFGLAAVSPFGRHQTPEIAAFLRFLKPLEILSPAINNLLTNYLSGDSALAVPVIRAFAFTIPMLVSTAVFLFLWVTLRRNAEFVEESVLSVLCRMAVGFALVSVFIYPIFTQDFWLSVAWGRMIQNGQNPYYQFFTTEALAGLPLVNFEIRMTYGPLWAMICAFLAFLSFQNVILEFLSFKVVLALFWIFSLGIIRKISAGRSPGHRALAICLFGWLPISFYQSIGEGHNDVVMIFFLLLWMYLVARNKYLITPLALTASALLKYITAPLIVLEMVQARSKKILLSRGYFAACLLSILLVGIVFVPFWRNPDFFSPVTEMRSWSFFTPAYTLTMLGSMLHIPLLERVALYFMDALFIGFVFYYGIDYYRHPKFPQFSALTLAILCVILFAGVGHVWPWFIIWVLAPAAVALHCGLLRFVLPVGLLGIFLNLYWLLALNWTKMHYPSIAFYAGVIGIMVFFRNRHWVDLNCMEPTERSIE